MLIVLEKEQLSTLNKPSQGAVTSGGYMEMFLFTKSLLLILGVLAVGSVVVAVLFEGGRGVIKAVWPEKLVRDPKVRFALARLVKRGIASRRELARAVGEPSPRSCGAKARTLNRLRQFGVRWHKTHNPERVRLSLLSA